MPACSRCTKAGQAANCLYLDDANDTPTRYPDSATHANAEFSRGPLEGHYSRPIQAHASPAGDTLSRLEYQERRIKQLELALSQSNPVQALPPIQQLKTLRFPLTPESVVAVDHNTPATALDRETMLLRGKSFKTQFHGTTHPGSLIAYIPELNGFTRETFERFPALLRIRQDMKTLEDRTEYAGSKYQSTTDADLKAMLPSKPKADELIQLYIDNFDGIYHILHLPSFRLEYDTLWSDMANAKSHFIIIVLLMMASAKCLTPAEPWLYTANSSTARERAVAAIQLSEDWLQTQSEKHVTVADFQIRFLIMFAKMVNARKYKRSWTEAGNMLRFCMAAGLHRNPELLRKPTSALDKEMRRRMWAAVTEWELQAAFHRGMVSTSWPVQSDCPPPSNIHDYDVDQSSEQLPNSRAVQEFTSSSYLNVANETVMLRHTLNTALNNIRQTVSFDEAKRCTDEIEAHLQTVPEWIGKNSEAAQALLSLNLRHYLLVLHDRQVRQASSPSERSFSKMIIIDNAIKITETNKALVDKGCYALQFLCQDQLRAALSACHVATSLDLQADTLISHVVEQRALQVVNDAIAMIYDKVVRWGREQRQLWIVLAAQGFMKAHKDPSQKLVCMQEAVDRITRPYYQIMAGQEDAPTAVSSVRSADRGEMPNGMLEYLPTVEPDKPSGYAVNDPALLDLDEMAAWTFEDFSFNPADFQNFGNPYQREF